ncbi:MAG TPA: DUF4407 domain-containing protein [Mycobacterium sp.]|nr:DUF4407 domain-containing protein [Mycobacterium sp.]HTX94435.1 DUF4407 domain-containing protein [Mycobacterium sp.]
MHTQELAEQRSASHQVAGLFTWLGGGHWRELGERHERSTHAVAGAVVLFGALLAWLVATLAVRESARLPLVALMALTLVFALLVGAVTRATTTGPNRNRRGIAARAAVAAAIGVVVGELAALVLLSGPIEHRIDERALRNADSAPAVAQASAALQQTVQARSALDNAVAQARDQQDKALIVARCEYHPTPGCPQTRITGVPGAGPETRTANELLTDAQQELDNALAARDRQAPGLDAKIYREQQAVNDARHGVVADASRGLGARWVAMNDLTSASIGALTLRLLTIAFCVLLYLLPLLLSLWRGETTHDRHATARAERERAELDADTAIAIKRAEVRREAEIMWAEHQVTQTRLAIEAQAEIDRENQRRRVLEAVEGPVHASAQRTFEPADEGMYLPIEAEAEAASRAITQVPVEAPEVRPPAVETQDIPHDLPAPVQTSGEVEPHEKRAAPLIPSIPDATKAAARWIRPLVPPFVARVVDTTTHPLRSARQVFEEVEEITFSLKRTHKVTVDSESSETTDRTPHESAPADAPSATGGYVKSSREHPGRRAHPQLHGHEPHSSLGRRAGKVVSGLPPGPERPGKRELTKRDGAPELPASDGPRELPPPK